MRSTAWSVLVLLLSACPSSQPHSESLHQNTISTRVESDATATANDEPVTPAPAPVEISPVVKTPSVPGAAWVLTIDGPGIDSLLALEADTKGGVTVLGSYQVFTRIGPLEIANPSGDVFETEGFIASFTASGEVQWTNRLPGSKYTSGAIRYLGDGTLAAVLPSFSVDGKATLQSVAVTGGTLLPRATLASASSPTGAMAVGADFLFTTESYGAGLLVSAGGSSIEVPSPQSVSRNGRVLAGSYQYEWRAGSKRFRDTGCRDDEVDGCSQGYILALDKRFKPRWSQSIGVSMSDESVELIAANDALEVAAIVQTADLDDESLDGTKLLRFSRTGKKLWDQGDAADISDMRLRADDTLVTVQARAGNIQVKYYDRKGYDYTRVFKVGGNNYSPKIAFSPTGDLYLAWHRNDGPHGQYLVVMRAAPGEKR